MDKRKQLEQIHDELMDVVREHDPFDCIAAMGMCIAEIIGRCGEVKKGSREAMLQAFFHTIQESVNDVAANVRKSQQ